MRATAEAPRSPVGELFAAILDHTLNVRIGNRFPLAEACAAHEALEGRATTGKVILELG